MNKKKLLALLMALVMTLTLVPVTAFAEVPVNTATLTQGGVTTEYQDFGYAYAAIDESKGDAVITLLANHNYNERMTFNKAFTLDLNGYTFTNSAEKYSAFNAQKDLTIKDSSAGKTGLLYAEHCTAAAIVVGTNSGTACTFTLESGTIQSETAIFDTWDGVTINVTGGKMVSYSKYGVGDSRSIVKELCSGCTLNISGGEFRSDQSAKSWDTMSFDPMGYPTKTINANSTIFVTGGTFSGQAIQKYVPGYTTDQQFTDANPTITVGDYTITRSTVSSPYGAAAYDVYLYTVEPVVTANYVAQIGDTKYETLAAAVAAVPANGTETTIEMIADSAETGTITIGNNQNVVLDLAGHEISYTENASGKSVYFLTNKGELTIQDTSENGNGNIVFTATPNSTSYSYETVTIYNLGGTLNFASGKITNASGGGLAYAVNNSSNAWGSDVVSTFNMTGGTVSAPNGDAALRVYQNTAIATVLAKNYVNISGGTILDSGIFVDTFLHTDGKDATNYEGANIDTKINITGGTVNGLIDMKIRHPYNTVMNISGGDFNNAKLRVRKWAGEYAGNGLTAGTIPEPTEPMVNISSGKWSFADSANAFNISTAWTTTSSWTSYTHPYYVTGGVFNVNLNNYDSIKFEDGKTGIANTAAATKDAYPHTVGVEAQPVAEFGDTQFTTLAAAIAAANENGGTVTLLRNYDMEANEPGYGYTTSYVAQGETTPRNNMIVIGDGVTFDLGGHTLSNLFNNTFNVTGDNVTIKNGTMNLGQLYYGSYSANKGVTPYANPTYGSYVMFVNGAANLTIDSLTTFGGINVAGGSTAVINDLYFSGLSFYAVCSQESSVVTLNGGNYDKGITGAANYLFWVENGSTMNITGGKYVKGTAQFISGEPYPVITGGTFDFDPTNKGVAPGYKAVDNGDGTWTVVVDPATAVARIDGTYFTTLEAAVDAAEPGNTITLIANNIAVTSTIEITKSITIDGNGKTINATGTGSGYVFNIHESDETPVTCSISNVTINAAGFQVALLLNSDIGSILNLDNVTVSSDGECVYGNGPSTVNAVNCHFTHRGGYASGKDAVYYSAVIVGYSGVVNLTNCDVKSTDYGVSTFPTGSTINLYNTNVSGTNGARGTTADPAALWVRVDGGYSHALAVSSYINVYAGSKITGALRTTNTTGGQKDALITCYENSSYSVDPRTCASTDHCGVIVPDDCGVRVDNTFASPLYIVEKLEVARNTTQGNITYTDLQEAFTEANENDTIVLLRDVNLSDQVEVTKKLTLNLADYKIHNTKDIWAGSSWSLLSVQNGGDLTITGNGKLMPKENDCYAIDVRDNGKLTVESGEIIGNVTAIYAHSGKVTISGGSFRIQQLADNVDTDKYRYTLNCLDANYKTGTSDFTVTGGKFSNFNPQNNLAEGANTNFVADGYEAVAIGGGWYQVGEIKSTAIAKDTTVTNNDTQTTYTASRSVVDKNETPIGNSEEVTVTVNLSASTGTVATNNKLPQYDQEKIVAKALEVSNADTMNVSIDVKHDNPQVVENKITYEVHPEATVKSNDVTVGTFIVTNDMLSGQTFTIKLPVPDALRTTSGKVKVTHKLNNGDEVVYNELPYDANGYVTIADVTEFSEFELEKVVVESNASAAYGFTLALKNKIEIPLYVYNLSDGAENYHVYYSYKDARGNTESGTVTLGEDNAVSGASGWYRVVVASFSARQLHDEVTVILYTGDDRNNTDNQIYNGTYSIYKYCDNMVNHGGTNTESLKTLCKAMMDYGTAAQWNFDYTDNVSDAYYLLNSTPDMGYMGSQYSNSFDTLHSAFFSYIGATLSLKSQTELNFYFTLKSGSIDDYTFKVNGVVADAQPVGTYYKVTASEITAKNLDKQVTVTVTNNNTEESYSYSPLNYAYYIQQNSTNDTLKTVCRGLYLYWQAANDYLK